MFPRPSGSLPENGHRATSAPAQRFEQLRACWISWELGPHSIRIAGLLVRGRIAEVHENTISALILVNVQAESAHDDPTGTGFVHLRAGGRGRERERERERECGLTYRSSGRDWRANRMSGSAEGRLTCGSCRRAEVRGWGRG